MQPIGYLTKDRDWNNYLSLLYLSVIDNKEGTKMQTISRNESESIVIQTPDGDEINIIVSSLNKDQIKISIDASSDYIIIPEELMTD